MSIRLMSEVYERQIDHAEQTILLALADHADDDGWHCFPSVALISWKTGYSERQVQRILSGLRSCGCLIVAYEATRYRPTEYHIDLSVLPIKEPLRGDKMSPMKNGRGDMGVTPGVTFPVGRGDIAMSVRGDTAMSPEPSGTIKEPSKEPSVVVVVPRPVTPEPEPNDDDVSVWALFGAVCGVRRLDPEALTKREERATETLAAWCVAEEITEEDVFRWGEEWYELTRRKTGKPFAAIDPPTCDQLREYFAGQLSEGSRVDDYAAYVQR